MFVSDYKLFLILKLNFCTFFGFGANIDQFSWAQFSLFSILFALKRTALNFLRWETAFGHCFGGLLFFFSKVTMMMGWEDYMSCRARKIMHLHISLAKSHLMLRDVQIRLEITGFVAYTRLCDILFCIFPGLGWNFYLFFCINRFKARHFTVLMEARWNLFVKFFAVNSTENKIVQTCCCSSSH